MKDIAFHITDLVENSIHSGARRIEITLSLAEGVLMLRIEDNGCGMSPEALRRVRDPFFTTGLHHRTGFGLPFLFQSAEQSGGVATVESHPGAGTVVQAQFPLEHINTPPAGDLGDTLMQAMVCNPTTEIILNLSCDEHAATIDMATISRLLGGAPTEVPRICSIIASTIHARIREVFGDALSL